MKEGDEILRILPLRIRKLLREYLKDWDNLQEIRLRTDRPVIFTYHHREYFLSDSKGFTSEKEGAHILSKEELRQAVEYISSYSLYAYEEQMKQGFLTIRGGHRIGLAGSVSLEQGKIQMMKHISCLNIRVAHQVKGCAEGLYKHCTRMGRVVPTLIISPPGCGKTTMLRDLIRLISNRGETVGVADERSEIGAAWQGIPQNDLGIRTDLMDGCPKDEGMNMLIRSMSPQVIAVDEVGSQSDIDALFFCAYRGCTMVATAHGKNMESLTKNPYLNEVLQKKMFQRYVLLSADGKPGTIEKILDENGAVLYD